MQTMPDRARSFLQLIRRSQRGKLKIYLGYGAGVGKTYQMLLEGHRLKAEGIDVVVGVVETHGRAETAKLVEGLEVVPRTRIDYHGITVEEMDLEGVLARKPQVLLVDELAHTNAPGSRNEKRYQDVQAFLAAGIHVISTLNLQHLESLYNTVEDLIGVKVRERIPDSVVAEADQVVNVDLAPEDLRKRLAEGKIYPRERVATALENFFKTSNLEELRELTLRELASQIDARRRVAAPERDLGATDQVMVCLSSRGPNSAKLLRIGSRFAGRLNRNWYAVYVQTPSEDPLAIDPATQRLISDTLTLANKLGAMVFTFKGTDVVDTILRFAREYRVGNIVIGRAPQARWWKRLLGRLTIGEELVRRAKGFTVIVVDAGSDETLPRAQAPDHATAPPAPAAPAVARKSPSIGELLEPSRIVVWDEPAPKARVIADLLEVLRREEPVVDLKQAARSIAERELQGSTFLNEGVALPHARLKGLKSPLVALGLPRSGVSDAPGGSAIEAVFLFLLPEEADSSSVQLLAAAGRLMQSADIRQRLSAVKAPAEALAAIREFGA
jgi:two-component system, OmpR family, sensor histidine kinase KdpD